MQINRLREAEEDLANLRLYREEFFEKQPTLKEKDKKEAVQSEIETLFHVSILILYLFAKFSSEISSLPLLKKIHSSEVQFLN